MFKLKFYQRSIIILIFILTLFVYYFNTTNKTNNITNLTDSQSDFIFIGGYLKSGTTLIVIIYIYNI
jgi:hypothetical protein